MYQKIKNWFVNHKVQLYIVGAFVVVFFAGVGAGKWTVNPRVHTATQQSNYTIKQSSPNGPKEAKTEAIPPENTPEPKDKKSEQVAGATTEQSTGTASCPIKGNISSSSKIYHVPGGSFYNRVKPEQCFKTEAEAQAAGFRKSSR